MARKVQNHIEKIINNNPNLLEIFELLHCGIALHTPDGIYHYANKSYRAMFGMSGDEPIGRHVRDYFDTADQGLMLAIKTRSEVMGTTAAKDGVYGIAYRIPLLSIDGRLDGVLAEVITAGYDRKNVSELLKIIQDLQKKNYYYQWETRNNPKELYSFERIIGESVSMRKLKATALRFASGRQTVLISGESGTGKDLLAQAVHMASERAGKSFITVNCAALPQELIESELFGYGPGTFTGAKSGGMKGKFEQAEGGTIFLDEIGELPLNMQSKLLRVLESGEIQKLGSSGSVHVDFRLLAATNRDLEQMVLQGRFREDLFHRLGVLELHIPPLREHKEEIPHLVRCFLEEMIGFKRAHSLEVSDEVMSLLRNYNWPGNIRELRNLLASTLYEIEEQETVIRTAHLSDRFLNRLHTGKPSEMVDDVPQSLQSAVAQAERQAILNALARSGGHKTHAAQALNISRSLLYKKIKELGIKNTGNGGDK